MRRASRCGKLPLTRILGMIGILGAALGGSACYKSDYVRRQDGRARVVWHEGGLQMDFAGLMVSSECAALIQEEIQRRHRTSSPRGPSLCTSQICTPDGFWEPDYVGAVDFPLFAPLAPGATVSGFSDSTANEMSSLRQHTESTVTDLMFWFLGQVGIANGLNFALMPSFLPAVVLISAVAGSKFQAAHYGDHVGDIDIVNIYNDLVRQKEPTCTPLRERPGL